MTHLIPINFKLLSNIAPMVNVYEPDSQNEGLKKNIGFKESGGKNCFYGVAMNLFLKLQRKKNRKKALPNS